MKRKELNQLKEKLISEQTGKKVGGIAIPRQVAREKPKDKPTKTVEQIIEPHRKVEVVAEMVKGAVTMLKDFLTPETHAAIKADAGAPGFKSF